jgi:SAM-dependent methyltransferase
MHFSLIKLLPRSLASNGFDDVILPLQYALTRLGWQTETRVNSINASSVNILFGTCHGPGLLDHALPANSIVFNLEQMTTQNGWNNPAYIEHLRRFTVWDYSHRNARYLRKSLGIADVQEVRLGYVPEMTRLNANFPQDTDVLFYGAVNERRKNILAALKSAGLRLNVLTSVYGQERDYAIARAKCIINVHYYSPATLEVARLGYLWANSKAVVSERQAETEIDTGLEESCRFCAYENIVEATCEIARSKTARQQQAEKGFIAFSALSQEDFLEKVVGRHSHGGMRLSRPNKLHAGSGKDFRQDCLNIDINPTMNPDLTLDLSQVLEPFARYKTLRFGEITLEPGSFTQITAFELLEHVRDLPQIMRNFLDLLQEGGELQLSVPYELSLGAWQDPTHVRAFNENSWLYYNYMAWYMGWREARFVVKGLGYTLSEYGKSLSAKGATMQEIVRQPRAVDGMHCTLRKRKSTEAEQYEYDTMHRSFYDGAVGEWVVRDVAPH